MPPAGSIVTLVGKAVQAHPATPYGQFLAHVVQPYVGIFAELVRLGELMVGVALVLGVLTRFGAIGGIVLALNFLAARGGLLSFEEWGRSRRHAADPYGDQLGASHRARLGRRCALRQRRPCPKSRRYARSS